MRWADLRYVDFPAGEAISVTDLGPAERVVTVETLTDTTVRVWIAAEYDENV